MSVIHKIKCDGCGMVPLDSSPTERDAVLAVTRLGWKCSSGPDFCPRCKPAVL